MSVQLFEYDARGTFSELVRIPEGGGGGDDGSGSGGGPGELLYRKTLLCSDAGERKQRIMWHDAVDRSVREAAAEDVGQLPVLIPSLIGAGTDEEEEEEQQQQQQQDRSHLVTVAPFFACGSVADLVALDASLQPADAVLVLFAIVDRLDLLHSIGIAHGNLRLENILLHEDNNRDDEDDAEGASTTLPLFFTDLAGVATATPASIDESGLQDDLLQLGAIAERLFVIGVAAGGTTMMSPEQADFVACCRAGGGDAAQCDKLLQHVAFADVQQQVSSMSDLRHVVRRLALQCQALRRQWLDTALAVPSPAPGEAGESASAPGVLNLGLVRKTLETYNTSAASASATAVSSLSSTTGKLRDAVAAAGGTFSMEPHARDKSVVVVRISDLSAGKVHVSVPEEIVSFRGPDEDSDEDDNNNGSNKNINNKFSFLWIFSNCEQSSVVVGHLGNNATVVLQHVESCWMRFGPATHVVTSDVHGSDVGAPCQFTSFQGSSCSDLVLRALAPRVAENVSKSSGGVPEMNDDNDDDGVSPGRRVANRQHISHLLFDVALPDGFALRCRQAGMPLLSSFLPQDIRSLSTTTTPLWLNAWGQKPPHLYLPQFNSTTVLANDGAVETTSLQAFCPYLLLSDEQKQAQQQDPEHSSRSSSSNDNDNNRRHDHHTYPMLASRNCIVHDVATDGNLTVLPDEASNSTISVIDSSSPVDAAAATSASPRATVLVYDVIKSATLIELSHCLVLLAAATDFVSIENCTGCDIHVVASKVRLVGCKDCRVFCCATTAAPVCFDSTGILIYEFVLRLPNLILMAQLARLPEQDGEMMMGDNVASSDDEEEGDENDQQQQHRRPRRFVRDTEFDGCDRDSRYDTAFDDFCRQCSRDPEATATAPFALSAHFDPLPLEQALISSMPQVQPVTLLFKFSIDSTMATHRNCFKFNHNQTNNNNNDKKKKNRQLCTIHDISNAAIGRHEDMLTFPGQKYLADSAPPPLPDLHIRNVDCGHIQISAPVRELRISGCRGGPLSIVVPCAVTVSLEDCANVTLMVACRSLRILSCHFCELSVLVSGDGRRPLISEDCRGIELSPFNLAAARLEGMLHRCGVVLDTPERAKAVNTYDDPAVVDRLSLRDLVHQEEDVCDGAVCTEDEIVKLSMEQGICAATSGASRLCPAFHISPPLLGVSLASNGNDSNNAAWPFLAEISDAVDEAATNNESLQSWLARQLVMLIPDLFVEEQQQPRPKTQQQQQQQQQQRPTTLPAFSRSGAPAAAVATSSSSSDDDGDGDVDDEAAASQNENSASELFKMLRASRGKSAAESSGDDDDDDDDGRPVSSASPVVARPDSAMGRLRVAGSINSEEEQEQRQARSRPETRKSPLLAASVDNKEPYNAALERLFDEMTEAAISDLVERKREEQQQEKRKRQKQQQEEEEEERRRHQQQQSGVAALPSPPTVQEDTVVALEQKNILSEMLECMLVSDVVEAGIAEIVAAEAEKQQQQEQQQTAADTDATKPKTSSPVKNRNFKRAPMAEKVSTSTAEEQQQQQQPPSELVRVPVTISRPAAVAEAEEEEEEEERQQPQPESSDHEQEAGPPVATATVGSLVSSFIESSSSSSSSSSSGDLEQNPDVVGSITAETPAQQQQPQSAENADEVVIDEGSPPKEQPRAAEQEQRDREEQHEEEEEEEEEEDGGFPAPAPMTTGALGSGLVPKLQLGFLSRGAGGVPEQEEDGAQDAPPEDDQKHASDERDSDDDDDDDDARPSFPQQQQQQQQQHSSLLGRGDSPSSSSASGLLPQGCSSPTGPASGYAYRLASAPAVTLLPPRLRRRFLNLLSNATPPPPPPPVESGFLMGFATSFNDGSSPTAQPTDPESLWRQQLQHQRPPRPTDDEFNGGLGGGGGGGNGNSNSKPEEKRVDGVPNPKIVKAQVLRSCTSETLNRKPEKRRDSSAPSLGATHLEESEKLTSFTFPVSPSKVGCGGRATADHDDDDDDDAPPQDDEAPALFGSQSGHPPQLKTRDMTLSVLCFDQKVDDALAEVRNRVIRSAKSLAKSAAETQRAMQGLHEAVRGKNNNNNNAAAERQQRRGTAQGASASASGLANALEAADARVRML